MEEDGVDDAETIIRRSSDRTNGRQWKDGARRQSGELLCVICLF